MLSKEPSTLEVSGDRVASGNARRRFFETRYWLRDLLLSILLAFIVIVFLYQPVQVEGTSMMPRLSNHDHRPQDGRLPGRLREKPCLRRRSMDGPEQGTFANCTPGESDPGLSEHG